MSLFDLLHHANLDVTGIAGGCLKAGVKGSGLNVMQLKVLKHFSCLIIQLLYWYVRFN